MSDRREAATSIESAARTAHGEARVALDAARVLAERQHRLAEARAARARLDERADDHDHDRARRDAALRAAPVLPLLEQLADAGAGLAAASTAVATGRSALADGPDGVRGLADADRPALIGHDESLVRDLGQINDLLADEAQLEGREAELSSLTEAMVTLDAELEELEAERGAIPARRQAVSDQLDDARAGAARRDALGAAVQQEEQRRAAAGDRDRLAQELAAATGALDDAAAAERGGSAGVARTLPVPVGGSGGGAGRRPRGRPALPRVRESRASRAGLVHRSPGGRARRGGGQGALRPTGGGEPTGPASRAFAGAATGRGPGHGRARHHRLTGRGPGRAPPGPSRCRGGRRSGAHVGGRGRRSRRAGAGRRRGDEGRPPRTSGDRQGPEQARRRPRQGP